MIVPDGFCRAPLRYSRCFVGRLPGACVIE